MSTAQAAAVQHAVPRISDVVAEIFARLAPFIPHTRASEVYSDLSRILSAVEAAQTELQAQVLSSRQRIARESAARREELESLKGKLAAELGNAQSVEQQLRESFEERSRLLRALSEREARVASLASQTQALRKSLTALDDIEVRELSAPLR